MFYKRYKMDLLALIFSHTLSIVQLNIMYTIFMDAYYRGRNLEI